tara:strand:+ start:1531 stop:2100 length:570 start_codon:yes stop_codon:yes gene_type:complete
MLKIAVSGAHGTGKTTLCEFLEQNADRELDLAICREVPRIIIETVGDPGFFKRGSNTISRQLLIFLYQMEEERKKGAGRRSLLCDRTPVDHLAYTISNHGEFRNTEEYVALRSLIAEWLATFDIIFKVPIEFQVQDDGVREGAVDFQVEIDLLIDELYAEYLVPVVVVTGSVEQRAQTIHAAIQSKLGA